MIVESKNLSEAEPVLKLNTFILFLHMFYHDILIYREFLRF